MVFTHRLNQGKSSLTGELKRKKVVLLVVVQIAIILSLLYFLFQRKNNLILMPENAVYFGDLLEVLEEIDDEVDICQLHKTKKLQNLAFANINTIPHLIPIRMSERTAVFRYTGDVEELFIRNKLHKMWTKDQDLIIKRVILKLENKPEEEEISLEMENKYVMTSYLSYRTLFKNALDETQDILWLFMEPLAFKLSPREIDRDEEKIRVILKDILHGLKYLHSKGIMHLDLKLANVMGNYSEEDKRVVYKIIDFGFSRRIGIFLPEIVFPGRSYGTFPYKAPEVWTQSIHSFSSDIWSLGMMAVFMANRDTSFFQKRDQDGIKRTGEGAKDYTKYRKFIEGNLYIPIHEGTTPEFVAFIHLCLDRDRHSRAKIETLLAHPFMLGKKLSPKETKQVLLQYFV
ncbi:hypothetical protein NEDG_01525 [Nematocida displodere]|uniref:Protein kinase domain-containing protein n=1 Tax=Nematocida displodere TaxID=1805483 RepID=A0A177EDT4_9MICR|nr:hypothetical protein NEDG_01525 [Nematocida displodere]